MKNEKQKDEDELKTVSAKNIVNDRASLHIFGFVNVFTLC